MTDVKFILLLFMWLLVSLRRVSCLVRVKYKAKFMIKNLLQRMSRSAYVGRLANTFQIFAFIILLQVFLGIHLLAESSVLQMGVLAFLQVLSVVTFRSLLWASLAWTLIAWPCTRGGRRLVVVGVVIFYCVLHLLESYLLGKYGEGYTFSVVTILMATTAAESKEYLTTVLSPADFFRGVIEILVSWMLTMWLPQRVCDKKLVTRGKRLLPVFLLLVVLADLSNLLVFMPRVYTYVSHSGAPIDATLSPVDRLIWNTGLVYAETSKIRSKMSEIEKIDLGSLEVKQPYGQINVVVVIGESLRRDYMHCYGYPLENTPKLDSLITEGSMIAYSNVISPAAGTVESLTKVLTYLSLESQGAWYDYPSLTNVLARSGYDTYWVSNQEITGEYVQPVNVIARMANHVRYIKMRTVASDWKALGSGGYDMEVLPYLHKSDSLQGQSVAQFVHLIGSHTDYAQRYPDDYDRFSSQDITARGDKRCIAEYVNSIYYNDDVVASIANHYHDEKAIVFYFSDHGEALFDVPGKPKLLGHGLPLKSNVEIPFMVYVSPKLRKEFPDLYERIVRYKDRPIVNDLFTNSLLGLLGITSKYSNEKLEFFSDGYDATRPRKPVNMKHSFSYD